MASHVARTLRRLAVLALWVPSCRMACVRSAEHNAAQRAWGHPFQGDPAHVWAQVRQRLARHHCTDWPSLAVDRAAVAAAREGLTLRSTLDAHGHCRVRFRPRFLRAGYTLEVWHHGTEDAEGSRLPDVVYEALVATEPAAAASLRAEGQRDHAPQQARWGSCAW